MLDSLWASPESQSRGEDVDTVREAMLGGQVRSRGATVFPSSCPAIPANASYWQKTYDTEAIGSHPPCDAEPSQEKCKEWI